MPDNDDGTQWRRMMSAIEEFLKENPHVHPDSLGIWLVSESMRLHDFEVD